MTDKTDKTEEPGQQDSSSDEKEKSIEQAAGSEQNQAGSEQHQAGSEQNQAATGPAAEPGKPDLLERIPQLSAADELAGAGSSQPPAQPRSKLAALAFLLALLASAAAGYLAWMQFQQQGDYSQLNRQVESNHAQVRGVEAAVNSSSKQVGQQISKLDSQLLALRSALDDANVLVESHSRRLLSLTATTTADWRIAEVEYLLRLASQRLLTSHDVGSALVMLRASDQILLELDDPRLFPVRSAIAEDSAALAAVGKQDLEGIFLRLSALSAQIDALPIISVPEFTSEQLATASADNDEAAGGTWAQLQQVFYASWQSMQSWIVVQQRDQQIKPLLPPEQQYYLRSNLRLLLNQAQIAALDGKEKAFADSLANAHGWLVDYFPQDEFAVQAMQKELLDIKATQIAIELPDISSSLLAIKAFIRAQHDVQVTEEVAGSGKQPAKDLPAKNAKANSDTLASAVE